MNKIVKAYQSNGFKAVRRRNLYYRLSKLKNAKDLALVKATVVTTSSDAQGVLSDITGDQSFQQTIVTNYGTDNHTNVGGRKKAAKKQ